MLYTLRLEKRMDDIKLSKIPELVREHSEGKVSLSYQQVHSAAVSGDIRGYQSNTGRWYVRPQDLPDIISDFTLKREQETLEDRIQKRSRELGVPVIPKKDPLVPPTDPEQQVVAICGKCGLELKRVMLYSCNQTDCPAFTNVTFASAAYTTNGVNDD